MKIHTPKIHNHLNVSTEKSISLNQSGVADHIVTAILKIITQICQTDVTTDQTNISVSLQLLIDRNMNRSKFSSSALLIKYKKKVLSRNSKEQNKYIKQTKPQA